MNQTHPSLDVPGWEAATPDRQVIVADGSNVKVTVRDGHLVVTDGVPGHIRERKLARVPRDVTRLLILARRGYITFEALRWLTAARVGVAHIAEDVTMTSGSQYGDGRIIHAQVKGSLRVARYLIGEKIRGQAETLWTVLGGENRTSYGLLAIAQRLKESHAEPISYLRAIEGQAARSYWTSWRGMVCVPWSPADLVKVPAHWRSFPGRPTLGSAWETNRHATDPVNAMLNYVYKVLETESLIACDAYGMHPDIGLIHAHGTDRHAFVLDLMEPVRPFCDQIVLRMLAPQYPEYFNRQWVHELGDGRCVLDPPLTHRIANCAADIGAAVREYAKKVREMLTNGL